MAGIKAYLIKAKMKYYSETQSILHVCIYTTKNEITSQIKTRALIKLYQTTILPPLVCRFEAWYINREDIKELTNIESKICIKTLNFNTETSTASRNQRIPNRIKIEETKRMYMHKAITSKARIIDVSQIKIEEYSNNKKSK